MSMRELYEESEIPSQIVGGDSEDDKKTEGDSLEEILGAFHQDELALGLSVKSLNPDQTALLDTFRTLMREANFSGREEENLYAMCVMRAIMLPGAARIMWLFLKLSAMAGREGKAQEQRLSIITSERHQENIIEQIEAKRTREMTSPVTNGGPTRA